jgi:iron complex outermembrane receptor protein
MIDYFQVQPETRRVNLLGRATYDINETGLKLYSELGYFTSKVEAIGTPGGLNDSGVFDPANPATPAVHTTVIPAGHPDNPTGAPRTLSLLTTMLGGRNGTQESEVFRGIVGLSGNVKEDWTWDVAAGYIRSELDDTNTGFVRYPVLQAALDDFSFRVDGSLNSPELLASISPALKRTPVSSVALLDGSIAGSLWDLPGGPLGIAFGAEYRTEKTDTPPVPFTDVAEIVGLGFSAFNADRDVYAAYTEVTAPVVDMLELNAAVRYDHYSDFGSSTTPKFGFRFKPLEQFVLRATYAEAFRAPGPAESGNSSSFGFTNIGILTIGNPDVQPEEAKSYTVGIVATPWENTSLTLDYYKIERTNEIVAADQAVVVGDLPTTGDPNSSIPGLIPNSFLFYDTDGLLGTISAPFVNANETNTDGLDLDIRTSFALGESGGELRAGLIWTHIFSFERILSDDVRFEYAGTQGPFVLSSAGGTPDDRGRFEASWERGPWTVTGALNYTSSMKMIDHEGEELLDLGDGTVATTTFEGAYFNADPNGPVCGVFNPDGSIPNNCETGSFTTTDLFVRFKGGDNWEVTGAVANLFDKVAPFNPYTYGGHNYNPSFHQAGAVGRFYTLGFRYGF